MQASGTLPEEYGRIYEFNPILRLKPATRTKACNAFPLPALVPYPFDLVNLARIRLREHVTDEQIVAKMPHANLSIPPLI